MDPNGDYNVYVLDLFSKLKQYKDYIIPEQFLTFGEARRLAAAANRQMRFDESKKEFVFSEMPRRG